MTLTRSGHILQNSLSNVTYYFQLTCEMKDKDHQKMIGMMTRILFKLQPTKLMTSDKFSAILKVFKVTFQLASL